MIQIEKYLETLTALLQDSFGSRLFYVGLQGSYLRGEATVDSDVYIMAVIDRLDVPDLDTYRSCIQAAVYADKACGFLCGKEDLLHQQSGRLIKRKSLSEERITIKKPIISWTIPI